MHLSYLLNSSVFLENRDSIILKVDFGKGSIGYSSFSPWVNLGQVSVKDILDSLHDSRYLKQTSTLLALAWKDAFIYNKSYLNCHSFQNHDFYNDKLIKWGSSILKIKLCGDIHKDFSLIENFSSMYKKLRLDANEKYELEDFLALMKLIKSSSVIIDIFEDPVKWSDGVYSKLISEFESVYVDQKFNNENYELKRVVVKPNLKNLQSLNYRNCVFTHNMGDALSDWHSYCDLLKYGDLELIHGIASENSINNKRLFVREKSLVKINPEAIKELYSVLTLEKQWIKL